MDTFLGASFVDSILEQTINSSNTIFRILLAFLAGGLIGLERESHAKPAGFRTHIIISVSACLLMLLSIYIPQSFIGFAAGDPGRIAAGVVTGIGFLGAGAIMRFGLTIKGMTSAASIWAISAVGMTIGAGFYVAAAITMIVLLITLHLVEIVEDKILGWTLHKKVVVTALRKPDVFQELKGILDENGIMIYDWSIIEKVSEEKVEYSAITMINSSVDVRKLFDDLRAVEGVTEIRME